jgi:putative acetyltransferase
MTYTIRPIGSSDNPVIAGIIRKTLAEFGANHPGTVFDDPATDHLYELFQAEKSMYNIALIDGDIVGGAGIYPTDGLPEDTCELVKMYLLPSARGIGLGKRMIEGCIDFAKANNFHKIYIETMPELRKAMTVYEKFGFQYINSPLGNTGHFGCNIWMLLEIGE